MIEEVTQDYSTTDAADVTEAATESSEAAEVTTGAAEIRDLDALGTFLISLIMIIIKMMIILATLIVIIIIKMKIMMMIIIIIVMIIMIMIIITIISVELNADGENELVPDLSMNIIALEAEAKEVKAEEEILEAVEGSGAGNIGIVR